MRSRSLNLIGLALLLGGLGALADAGVAYMRGTARVAPQHWTRVQTARGRAIAQRVQYQNNHLLHVSKRALAHAAGKPGRIHGSLATYAGEPGIRMVIPKIALDAPMLETVTVNGVWQVADWAVGHLVGTAQPGQVGNMAVAAHDDIKGEIFKRIHELNPGDKIFVYTRHAAYTYVVTGQQVVDPSDSAVLAPTAQPTITMITCTPYWVDGQRLIVSATLQGARAR